MESELLMSYSRGEPISDANLLALSLQYRGVLPGVSSRDIYRMLGNYDRLATEVGLSKEPDLGNGRSKLLEVLHRRHEIHAFGNSEFYESTFLDDLDRIPLLREGFIGRKVIELGPERNPVYPHLAKLGIAGYTAVEPNYADETSEALKGHEGKTDVVKVDGLSYLLTQPNDSSIVISFGVLPFCSESYEESTAKEIYRVTVPGGISVHSPKREKFGRRYPYLEAGFRPIEEIVKGLETRCDVFVKPPKN